MPKVDIADEAIVASVMPAIRMLFRTVRSGRTGSPGFGLCMKVATITMRLLDEEADARSPAAPEDTAQYQRNAERIAKAAFDAIVASGGPLN